ncbi:hypothetical protein CBW16_05140 [Flavobacteriaceae bacterium JJC]|nr:hypothetical protein CBW16_05140 [Flavobacteriaceae bacterium JJC]
MKLILTLCLLQFTFSFAQNKEYKEYYDSGKLKISTYTDKDGKFDGEAKSYYESGKLMEEGKFSHDLEDGDFKTYYENGKIDTQGKWKNGLKTGVWKLYKDDGTLEILQDWQSETQYTETQFYPNGKKRSIGTIYVPDNIVSQAVSGKEVERGEWQFFHENGNLKASGNYENGKRNGEWKSYDEKGTLRSITQYLNDVPFKLIKKFDEKGKALPVD